jgi:hypothetical protein
LEGGAPTEVFASEKALVRRLADIGFGDVAIRKNIFNLRNHQDANWSHLEVPHDVFENFGRRRE